MADKVIQIDGVGTVAFPDSMSDDDISNVIQQQHPNLAPKKPSATDQALALGKGLFSALNPMNIVGAAEHPIDTLSKIWDMGAQQRADAKAAFDRGEYGKALDRAIPGVIPLLGPLADKIENSPDDLDAAHAYGQALGVLFGPKIYDAALKGTAAVAKNLPTPGTPEVVAGVTGHPMAAGAIYLKKAIPAVYKGLTADPAAEADTAALESIAKNMGADNFDSLPEGIKTVAKAALAQSKIPREAPPPPNPNQGPIDLGSPSGPPRTIHEELMNYLEEQRALRESAHGGVENTPIPGAQPATAEPAPISAVQTPISAVQTHPPFAETIHKSPATVARQLKGIGTLAEGLQGVSADSPLLKNPKALKLAQELADELAAGGNK